MALHEIASIILAYANLFGRSIKGHLTCPFYAKGTRSVWMEMNINFIIWVIEDGCLKIIILNMMLLDLMGMWSMVLLQSLLMGVLFHWS